MHWTEALLAIAPSPAPVASRGSGDLDRIATPESLLVVFLQKFDARKTRREKPQTYQAVAIGGAPRHSACPVGAAPKIGKDHSNLQCMFSKSCDFNSLRYILDCPQQARICLIFEQWQDAIPRLKSFACQFKINPSLLLCSGNLRTREDLEIKAGRRRKTPGGQIEEKHEMRLFKWLAAVTGPFPQTSRTACPTPIRAKLQCYPSVKRVERKGPDAWPKLAL